jgi:group I intron endonuclease
VKVVGIYKITSPFGRVYIGQSWNITKRLQQHKYLESKGCFHIHNSIKKHGRDAHTYEILHRLPLDVSQEVMDSYEVFYIDQHLEAGIKMMNLRAGGSHGKLSEETKRKIGENNWKGKHLSEDHKKKLSLKNKGFKHSDETKRKMSQTRMGSKMPMVTLLALIKSRKGVITPESVKEKIRQSKCKNKAA